MVTVKILTLPFGDDSLFLYLCNVMYAVGDKSSFNIQVNTPKLPS